MSNTDPATELHAKLNEAMSALREGIDIAEKIDWFASSPAAPHLNMAAQSLFVAINRLESALADA